MQQTAIFLQQTPKRAFLAGKAGALLDNPGADSQREFPQNREFLQIHQGNCFIDMASSANAPDFA
jgi:hypothetical protein